MNNSKQEYLIMLEFVWTKFILEQDKDLIKIFQHMLQIYEEKYEEKAYFKSSHLIKAEIN